VGEKRLKRALAVVCGGLIAAQLAWIGGCSVYMENTRPTPTNLIQYAPGTTRDDVLAKLGAPITSSPGPGGMSCDLYRLYTKGYGEAGKIPLSVLEVAADVFTIGLAEIVLTPTEAMTKNDQHPVDFCYKDQKLVSVEQRPETVIPVSEQTIAVTAAGEATGSPVSSITPEPTPAASASAASTSNPESTAIPAVPSSQPTVASAIATTAITGTPVSTQPGGIRTPDIGGEQH
jgi:hypothetical protein